MHFFSSSAFALATVGLSAIASGFKNEKPSVPRRFIHSWPPIASPSPGSQTQTPLEALTPMFPTIVPTATPTTLIKLTTSAVVAIQTESKEETVVATTTPASSSDLTADQQAALDAHNAARSDVSVGALTWDADLAANAQEWATHLTTVGTLTHAEVSDQGENLYMQSGTTNPYINAANMWIAEKSSYSGQAIDDNYATYGHYTQIVWSSTTKVGMAIATGSNGDTYVVARYSPPGNYFGEKPY
ncbi:hypothetical protein AK830_g7004 [Neonectria ditissima]|uniref:SCP domain-containing protein n=1 Tax=Neonectria ditissima TaxID=78410 RepID=A0A0P7BG82_9HYPO|nr:hypothetical protein AK830_g7004 [Neonectria ditissima]